MLSYLFEKPILLLQETTALFPQLTEIDESFKCKILQQQNSNFFGATTADLLRCIDDERTEVLKSGFQDFYAISLECVDKWFYIENHPTHTNWTLLRDQIVKYEEVVDLAKQLDPEMAMMDELFDEITVLNNLLKKIPLDVFRKGKAENKWMNIFSTNDFFPLLYKLIALFSPCLLAMHLWSLCSPLFWHNGPKRETALPKRQSSLFYK